MLILNLILNDETAARFSVLSRIVFKARNAGSKKVFTSCTIFLHPSGEDFNTLVESLIFFRMILDARMSKRACDHTEQVDRR